MKGTSTGRRVAVLLTCHCGVHLASGLKRIQDRECNKERRTHVFIRQLYYIVYIRDVYRTENEMHIVGGNIMNGIIFDCSPRFIYSFISFPFL